MLKVFYVIQNKTGNISMAEDTPPENQEQFSGEFQHAPVTARIPENVANGVFANGVIVLAGPHEIVCDFVLRLMPPYRVVGRVVLSFTVAQQFVQALRHNLDMYQENFGTIPPIPHPKKNPALLAEGDESEENIPRENPEPSPMEYKSATSHLGQQIPSINEVYREMKINEPELAGHYCNAVLIRHTPTEYCFDFIANIFPKSVVTMRVIMPTPHVPSFYTSIQGAIQQRRP